MLCHEIVEFMNNELVTRDFGVCLNNDIIKTFKDETGYEYLNISIRTNGYDSACYWFLYDSFWWKGQNLETMYNFNEMTFQVNNRNVTAIVHIACEIVSVNKKGIVNKTGKFLESNMIIEYNDCVFNENIVRRLRVNKNAKLNNCHLE